MRFGITDYFQMDVLGFKVNDDGYPEVIIYLNLWQHQYVYDLCCGPDGDLQILFTQEKNQKRNDVVLRKYDSVSICADHGKQ